MSQGNPAKMLMAGFGGYNVPSLETRGVPLHLASYSEWILPTPFQAMKMFLYEELGVKKTTSSWQKVHPKQKNLPENKALLSGGAR